MRRILSNTLFLIFSSTFIFGCQTSQTGLENLQQASDGASQQQTSLVKPRGYVLPTSFSIAPHTQDSTLSTVGDLIGSILSDGDGMPADSDNFHVVKRSYVYEPLLEQFGLVDNILFGLAQTHYDERENVNVGPYSARVYIRDGSSLVPATTYQDWVIESEVETKEGETDIHTVRAWIDSYTDSGLQSMHVELTIYSPAYVDGEGAVSDFGQWDLRVNFPAQPNDFMVTKVRYLNSEALIHINSRKTHWLDSANTNVALVYQGELHRGRDRGFGKFRFSDLDFCHQQLAAEAAPCSSEVPVREVSYAYNKEGMSVQRAGDVAVYRDRKQSVQIPIEYGLYNSVTGEDIKNSFQFEFPISYTDPLGQEQWARYLTENGRHHLAGLTAGQPPVDSTVIRRQIANRAIERPYQVAHHTEGVLYQVVSSNEGVSNELEHWNWEVEYDRHWILKYDAHDSVWRRCLSLWHELTGCGEGDADWIEFADMESLTHIEQQRLLNYDMISKTNNIQLVYLEDARAHSGDGFYEAGYHVETGQLESVGARWSPSDGEVIELNMQASLLLKKETDTNQWYRFRVTDSLLSSQLPISSGDTDLHDWQPGVYHLRQPGRKLMLKVEEDGSKRVVHEHWHALHPNTVSEKEISDQILFRGGEDSSQLYRFQNNDSQTHFMSLVYASGAQEGELVRHSVWDLWQVDNTGALVDSEGNILTTEQLAADEANDLVNQYRWVYREDGSSHQTFFKDAIGDWVQLAAPRSFEAVKISKQTVSLRYDSQLQGLIHPIRDLTKLGWQLHAETEKHLVQIREEIELQDRETQVKYLAKPIVQFNLSQHLDENSVSGPDLTQAHHIEFDGLPEAEQTSLTHMPAVSGPKYIGGLRTQ